MLNITLDLDTGLAKLAAPTTIKVGAAVPVTIATVRDGVASSPGSDPAFELGLGTDEATPALKAYCNAFATENAHTFTGLLDANDARLVTFMVGKGTVSLGCEIAWTVAGELQVAPTFSVPVQPRIISGPAGSEGGPVYLTAAQVTAAIAAAAAGAQPLDSDLTSIAALVTTSFGRSALTLANAAAARTLFGVAIGTDVQAYNGTLATLAANASGTSITLYNVAATFASVTSAGLIQAGKFNVTGDISAPAWTTNGIRFYGAPGTLTDTTSSGTVSLAYTSRLGGNTIAASSATTFGNYYSFYLADPVAGTNVTLAYKWALGSDSLRVGTSNQVTITPAGLVTIPGTLAHTGTASLSIPLGTVTLTGNLPDARNTVSNSTTTSLTALTTLGAAGVAVNVPGTTSASSSIVGALKIGNGTAATNVAIGGGNINAGGTITIGGGKIGITGAGYSGGSDATAGTIIFMGYNSVGNRQLWIGDPDNLGSSTKGFFRFITSGTAYPAIDGIRGDGAVATPVSISAALVVGNGLTIGTYPPGTIAIYGRTTDTAALSVRGNTGIAYLNVTSLAGSAGDIFSIGSAGDIILSKTITAAGTTGAQTINKSSGTVNFAAAATSLVLTNSLISTSSVLLAGIGTNDSTAAGLKWVCGAGSVTFYLATAPTAGTRIPWRITN